MYQMSPSLPGIEDTGRSSLVISPSGAMLVMKSLPGIHMPPPGPAKIREDQADWSSKRMFLTSWPEVEMTSTTPPNCLAVPAS
jgi:hypothetical protein